MLKITVIYWRDIPSQIIVQQGRSREKVRLSSRFQEAIDRAAMRAGKGSSDAYLAEWRRISSTIEDNEVIAEVARREAAQLEHKYTDEQLLQLIRGHGSEKS